MVPKGWAYAQLEKLGSKGKPAVKAGPFGSSLKKEFYVKSGYKVYGQEQVLSGDAFYGDYYIDAQRYESLKSCSVNPGDILISLVGTVGRALLLPDNCEDGIINPRLLRVSLDDGVIFYLFIRYFLESNKTVSLLHSWAQGGTMGVLNAEMLKKLIVPIPPIEEQKKIAQILSAWDSAISVTEKLLTNSQQQKKNLMQQLLTGKKRLLDENEVRFSGEWEKGKLGDIANIDTGYAFKSNDFTESASGVPIIRMSDFKTGRLDTSNAARVDSDCVKGLERFQLKIGDFVFGMSGSLNNYGQVRKENIPCYLNQRVGRLVAKGNASQTFIAYMYLSELIQKEIIDKAAGAAQLNISINDLRSIKILFPDIKEQQKIASVLSAADAEISTLEKKLACLKDEKKALMQQLLTGKRRVVVDADAA